MTTTFKAAQCSWTYCAERSISEWRKCTVTGMTSTHVHPSQSMQPTESIHHKNQVRPTTSPEGRKPLCFFPELMWKYIVLYLSLRLGMVVCFETWWTYPEMLVNHGYHPQSESECCVILCTILSHMCGFDCGASSACSDTTTRIEHYDRDFFLFKNFLALLW